MLNKVFTAVLAVAMVALYTPFSVNAQSFDFDALADAGFTAEDIALLMSLFGTTTTTTGSSSNRGCDADYLRDLSVGSTGADVMNLQEFLNDAGYTVSASGAGSVGMETMYYGSLTANAVTRFQNANAAKILAPLGLTSGTGYFGAGTRAAVREMCAATPTTPTTPGTPDDGDDDDDDNDGLSGGEASLEDFDLTSEDDVEEGDMAHVATAEVDVEDGDVRFSRMDLEFVFTGDSAQADDEPWDVFETVTVMVDGDEIAEEDVDDEDDWLRDDSPFVFRLSGLDYVAREGDNVEFEIYLTAQSSVDGADTNDASWTIAVDDDGLRAVDSEGIQNYAGDDSDTVSFDVEEEGSDADLDLSESSDNPDESTIEVDDNDDSDWYAITVGDLDADGSFELEEATVDFVIYGADANDDGDVADAGDVVFDEVVSDMAIEIDGTEIDDYTVGTATVDSPANTDATYTVTFDLDDFEVEDEEVQISVLVEFKPTDDYSNGQQVSASLSLAEADIDGPDGATYDLDDVDGEVHTLRASGVFASDFSSSYSENKNDSGQVVSVTWTLEFDVSAFDEDAYIYSDVNRGAGAVGQTYGLSYVVEDSGNNVVSATDADAAAALSSSADEEGNYFVVRDGNTESFELVVTVDDGPNTTDDDVPGFVRIQLLELFFNDSEAVSDAEYDFAPANDYDSSLREIQVDTDA